MKLPPGMHLRRGSTYYARVWVRDRRFPRGGRDRWFSLGKDFEEAKRKLLKLQLGGKPPDREGRVDEMAEAWLATYVPTHRSTRSQNRAEGQTRLHLIPYLGALKARAVTADHLRRYRVHLEGKGLQEQTVLHLLSDVRCLFLWGQESGWIERSPWPRRLMPKVPEKPPKYLSADEQAALVTLPEPYRLACLVMLHSGARYEELCRLQASDLDGDVLCIHGETKSRRLRRVVLPQWLVVEVRTHIGKLVPFEAKSVSWFNRAVRRHSGVEGFTTRKLRHTYSAVHAQRGSLEALRQLLGHASVTTTQRYAKLGEDLVLAEARRVAEN